MSAWLGFTIAGIICELVALGLIIPGIVNPEVCYYVNGQQQYCSNTEAVALWCAGAFVAIIGTVFFTCARRVRLATYLQARRNTRNNRGQVIHVQYVSAPPGYHYPQQGTMPQGYTPYMVQNLNVPNGQSLPPMNYEIAPPAYETVPKQTP